LGNSLRHFKLIFSIYCTKNDPGSAVIFKNRKDEVYEKCRVRNEAKNMYTLLPNATHGDNIAATHRSKTQIPQYNEIYEVVTDKPHT